MPKLSKKTQEKLKNLEVAAIYLFGSKAEGAETAFSDIDIGIIFKSTAFLSNSKITRKRYNEIYDIVSVVFHPSFSKELDLVFLQQTPISLQYQAISKGKIFFEALSKFRANYEERVMIEYLDFKPILDYTNSLIIKRIA